MTRRERALADRFVLLTHAPVGWVVMCTYGCVVCPWRCALLYANNTPQATV
eukprot:COSAG06_NODE_32302_length_508_cov_1.215159_1_plen_50_part_01